METHKSKTKFGGEIIIHTDCSEGLSDECLSPASVARRDLRRINQLIDDARKRGWVTFDEDGKHDNEEYLRAQRKSITERLQILEEAEEH